MGNKSIPDEVTTAMELAAAANWGVSNRNKKIIITPPDGMNITIGHGPNDESMKVWRSSCRRYNLIAPGPARTPDETVQINDAVAAQSLAEADRRNDQRKAYEAEQRVKQQQIEAARQKADAATQQGLKPQETPMPKNVRSASSANLFPPLDPALLGTKDYSKFQLSDGLYYCVECWSQGKQETFKAPQGIAAHRGVRHRMYSDETPATQETNRVSLPADVDTAIEMLRSAVADSLGLGVGSEALAAKDIELDELKAKLEKVSKQADADRSDFDKRFLEAQASADKKLEDASQAADSKRETEIQALMKNFMGILLQVREATETLSPIQAIAKIDTIVSEFLKK